MNSVLYPNIEPADAYVAIPPASFPALAAMTPGPRIAMIAIARTIRRRRGAGGGGTGTVLMTGLVRSTQEAEEADLAAIRHEGVDEVVGEDAADRTLVVVDHEHRRAPRVDEPLHHLVE